MRFGNQPIVSRGSEPELGMKLEEISMVPCLGMSREGRLILNHNTTLLSKFLNQSAKIALGINL